MSETMDKSTSEKNPFRSRDKLENQLIFAERKDQCDMCVKHKVGAISDADHALHLQLKNAVQKEKENDKIKSQ